MSLSPRRRSALTVQALRGLELPTQFALSILVARTLGPSEFGIAGIFISVQTICLTIAAFGFDELLQRAVSRNRDSLPDSLGRALRVRILSCVLLGVGAALTAVGLAAIGDDALVLPVLLIYIATVSTLVSNVFVSVAFSTYSVLVPLVASLSQWVVPLALSLTQQLHSVAAYIGALAIGAFVRLVITMLWASWRGWGRIVGRALIQWARPRLLETLREHISLIVYNLNNQVLARHGDVIIAGMVGISLSAIGAYGLAFQITATANSFLMIGLGAVGLSRLSEMADDRIGLGRAWRQLSEVASLIAVGPLAVLPLITPELVRFLFGDKYPLLIPLMVALCLTQWVNRITGGGTNIGALIARGDAKYVARNSITGAVLNIILDVVGGLLFGIFGLVAATGIAMAAVGVSNTIRISRELDQRPPLGLFAVLSAIILAAISATVIELPWIWRWSAAILLVVVWAVVMWRTVRK